MYSYIAQPSPIMMGLLPFGTVMMPIVKCLLEGYRGRNSKLSGIKETKYILPDKFKAGIESPLAFAKATSC